MNPNPVLSQIFFWSLNLENAVEPTNHEKARVGKAATKFWNTEQPKIRCVSRKIAKSTKFSELSLLITNSESQYWLIKNIQDWESIYAFSQEIDQ